MPIRKDETGRRWVEMEVLVPGTPEEVWQAMATGAGNAAWFTRSEIEPRVGGAFRLEFGQGVATTGEVSHWEPPHLFGYVERDWQPGAPPVATEITIAARSGGRCVVRMVHSLFASTDDWDDQLEGFEDGWPGFFAVLRVYLAHFAGSDAASFMAMAAAAEDELAAWKRLRQAFGMEDAHVGERRAASSAPEPLAGVLEEVHQDRRGRYAVLRLDEPSAGVALVGTHTAPETVGDVEEAVGKRAGTNVTVCRYFYGDGAAARSAEVEPGWRAWMGRTFGGSG